MFVAPPMQKSEEKKEGGEEVKKSEEKPAEEKKEEPVEIVSVHLPHLECPTLPQEKVHWNLHFAIG